MRRRSQSFRCRTGAAAPVLSVAEYALIRPPVPVIPGRQDMPKPPAYVPVTAHYVNPNGRPSERRHLAILIGALVVGTAALCLAVWIFTGWQAAHPSPPPAPGFTTMPAAGIPTTYGPPR